MQAGPRVSCGPVTVPITNKRGLHARASARLVGLAAQFDATVHVGKDGQEVTGTSIMGLMMLAAGIGDSVEVRADGPQAAQALDAIVALIGNRFGED